MSSIAPDDIELDIDAKDEAPEDCARGLRKYLFVMALVVVATLAWTFWYKAKHGSLLEVGATEAALPAPRSAAAPLNPPIPGVAPATPAMTAPRGLTAALPGPGPGPGAAMAMALPAAREITPGDFAAIAAQLHSSVVAVGRAQPDSLFGRTGATPTAAAPGDPGTAIAPDGKLQFATPAAGAVLESIGTGVVVRSDGYILTNYHVVRGGNAMMVTIFDETGSQRYTAEVVRLDASIDLALLKVQPRTPLIPAVLGDSDRVQVAEEVIAIGSPFGLDMTVSRGIISAKRKSLVIEGTVHRDLLQTDAAINQGNSGGPLVSRFGEVIGINTAIYTPTGAFSGVGFAIPSNQARLFLAEELATAPMAERPVQAMTAAWPGTGGSPAPGSAVGTAGPPILAGVASPHRDGRETMDCAICHQLIPRTGTSAGAPPGAAALGTPVAFGALQFARPPSTLALNVAVAGPTAPPAAPGPNPGGFAILGATTLPVTAPLAQQLGQPEGKGVFVATVAPDSPAAAAGLQAGSVIEKIDGRRIRTPREMFTAVQGLKIGDSVRLGILQGTTRKEIRLTVAAQPIDTTAVPGTPPIAGGGAAPAGTPTGTPTAPKVPTEFNWRGLEVETFAPVTLPGAPPGTKGAVVGEVLAGSPGQRLGVLAGDTILEMGGQPTGTAALMDRAVQSTTGKTDILLRMARNNREFFVVMP